MKSRISIKLIMLEICGKMLRIVSISSLIAIDALTSLKILMMRKPRMTDVVAPIAPPAPANFITRPKSVPKAIKQSKTFDPDLK